MFWSNLYVDQINLYSGRGQNLITIEADSATNDPLLFKYDAANCRFRFQGDIADYFEINLDGGDVALNAVSVNSVYINETFRPSADSTHELGTSIRFWDKTFTDELILTNVGAAAAAADKLVLSAVDLSAGNTILDINTEGTGVEGTGTPAADKTIAIRVNGNVRYLLASTAAS